MPTRRWTEHAACQGVDTSLFYGPASDIHRECPPEKKARETEAKRICGGCWVKADCLEYALDHGEKYGIWAGLNEDERADERRRWLRRRRAAA